MIIAGYSGVGKSTFCEANEDKAIDFIIMPYKYSNFYEVAESLEEGESIKAHDDLEFIPNWQVVYYAALRQCLAENPDKYIVIPTEIRVLNKLYEDGIPFTMVYPEESLQEKCRNRYKERGDSENFMSIFADSWEYWMEAMRDCPCDNRIVLKTGEYLSDVIR